MLASLRLLLVGVFFVQAQGALFAQVIFDKDRNAASIPELGDKAAIARSVMHDFAKCVLKRSRPAVDAYLATYSGSKPARAFAARLATDKCLNGGNLNFNEALLRASIYNILYVSEFPPAPLPNLKDVEPIDYTQPAGIESYGDPRAQALLRQFADCVVRAKSSEAHALMFTKVGSVPEARVFDSMQPSLAPCMTKDVTVKFSRSVLRGIIAEVLYRLSRKASGHAIFSAEKPHA
jgi:hypothetical protein